MKKIVLFLAVLTSVCLSAQTKKIAQKVAELQNVKADFKVMSVLLPSQNVVSNDISKVVEGATLATINTAKVNQIANGNYDFIELEIPYQNQIVSMLLYKVNPFAEGFHVDTNKNKNIGYQKGAYYRGIIKGNNHSVAAFNFFNGEFNGIVSSEALGNLVVGKLDKPGNQTDYIVYSDAKMKVLNQFECAVKNEDVKVKPLNKSGQSTQSPMTDRCVTFYFEVDYNLYVNNNSNTTTTTNWMTSVFNNVQTLYDNDAITVGLKSIFIWTDLDPYEGVGTSSSDYLSAFNTERPVFDGDLGQLIGRDPGGLGGLARTINGLCSNYNICYSDVDFAYSTVPTFSWTVQVITHEFGHLLGSYHTHQCAWNGDNTVIDGCGQQAGYGDNSCPQGPIPSGAEKGTIMSYCHLISGVGINFLNGFGPQPTELITNTVNGSTCLSFDCINTCINTITDITPYNITPNSVSVSWTDDTSTSWEIAVTPFASTAITWTTVTTPDYTVSGLNANTYYKIRIRPLCLDVEAAGREKVFATLPTNACSSVSFTDTGGTSGSYTNNQNWVRTMTPYNSGLKLRVTFSSFNLENLYDYLYIYNGPNEFYADLTMGGLTGTALPSPYNSTATDGSLTFKFVSDEGVVAPGWNAIVTCTGSLGVEDNNYLDYSYYPNPTNGIVTITSKDAINEVAVYNVQGQLLFNQKMNEMTTHVDMAKFATGTYFFKLKINGNDANFKILKM